MQPITQTALDQVVSFLAPLFMLQTLGDELAARDQARAALATYGATTDQQVRLTALFIAFSMQALANLGRTVEPGLDVKTVLRLNANANALTRAAMQAHRALGRSQAAATDGLPPQDAETPAMPLPEPLDLASLLQFIQCGLPEPAPQAPASAGLSRQQRRALQRQARKIQQRRAGRAAPPALDAAA